MHTKVVKRIKLTVPSSLSDISLAQYQEFMSVIAKNVDEEGKYNEGSDEVVNTKALEIFCGVKPKDIALLPMEFFNEVLSVIEGCLKEKPEFSRIIEVKDKDKTAVKFGFIPNLEKMTYGEFIDLNQYFGDWSNAHKMMAILYRPITSQLNDKYAIEDYSGTDKWADFMKGMPVSYAKAAEVFFCDLTKELSEAILKYSPGMMMQSLTKDGFQENGDGTRLSTNWRGAILRNTNRLKSWLTAQP